MDKFIPTDTVHWIHLIFSQNCDFLNHGHLYSDCTYSSSRDSFEVNLLEELWQEFMLCIKLKIVDDLLLLSELAAQI